MAVPSTAACRSCGSCGMDSILDLGMQPDPDCLLDPSDPQPAPEAHVELVMCSTCALLQLSGPRPDGPHPTHGHAMTIPDGDPWVTLIKRSLSPQSHMVLDVDGTSGLPSHELSATGTVESGLSSDGSGQAAGLVLVGHALTHTDDINGILDTIEAQLAPKGLVAIDFHHALGLTHGQFDVIAHTHRSYLTLHSLERVLDRHGLGVVAAQRIQEYGGTVRVLAARRADDITLNWSALKADRIRETERIAGVDRPAGYEGLEQQVRARCSELVMFLDDARRAGRTISGYGAAARGTTLLNLAGVGTDLLPFTVDRAQTKQGRLLPRARIPVFAPSRLESETLDDILILPWPLSGQIAEQLSHMRRRGTRFVVALPRLESLR